MRPAGILPHGDTRTRKDLETTASTPLSHSGAPMSFFVATEAMLHRKSASPTTPSNDNALSVQSLQENVYESRPEVASEAEDDDQDNDDSCEGNGGRRRSTLKPSLLAFDHSPENIGHDVHEESGNPTNLHSHQRRSFQPRASESLTSLSQASQAQGSSLPSSPKSTSSRSFRPSDEESADDGGSQAIASSEEDDVDSPSELRESAPQLIMPSIKMPSRRPFTERGKAMGRLKILIAGDSGVGKTSLIKSIVQTCEDIVHVDPLSSNPPSVELPPRKSNSKRVNISTRSTDHITEVHASTKAYPPWWTEIEETRFSRRRKSMSDTILERNLCFVDTPGYSHGISMLESIESVVRYVEAQLTKVFSHERTNDGDFLSMLSGNGGTQVDVVFYMISQQIKATDLEFLQRLSALTNIIPLIAKSDLLSNEDVQTLRTSIAGELHSAGIRSFILNPTESTPSMTYTVCSAPSNDEDNMDASLLMSPDYVQPLLSSELAGLIHQVFDKDNISWLRHLSALKLIHVQKRKGDLSMEALQSRSSLSLLHRRSLISPPLAASPSSSQMMVSHASGASSYVQIRVADHTQREEKLAQVRLAKWARDLQRSLQNERKRYEALSRGERALWLTQRLGECVSDGSLVPVKTLAEPSSPDKGSLSLNPDATGVSFQTLGDGGDPLGLLRWNEAMKRRGRIAFQVVGSFGILGAVAVWMARSWGIADDASPGWTWIWWGNRL